MTLKSPECFRTLNAGPRDPGIFQRHSNVFWLWHCTLLPWPDSTGPPVQPSSAPCRQMR